MPLSVASSAETAFGRDVLRGLTAGQKHLPSVWLYDELGSALFEAITALPEYGLTRADSRLLQRHSHELAQRMPASTVVAELGSGSGKKTRYVLGAIGRVRYYPVDISAAALALCEAELQSVADVEVIEAPFLEGISRVAAMRDSGSSLLVLFLGSTIGNFDRREAATFLRDLRSYLQPGDGLLLGADLVKPVPKLIAAYDDALGVTAAFNRNLLLRINRELGADFVLDRFVHEARYSTVEQRVEMHLRSVGAQQVSIPRVGLQIAFRDNETIWTESSHKYTATDLDGMASLSGFVPEIRWVDKEWSFAECLWRVR